MIKKHNCPICLFSSGIVANGKGTKCSTCNGKGWVGKTIINELRKKLGDIIKVETYQE